MLIASQSRIAGRHLSRATGQGRFMLRARRPRRHPGETDENQGRIDGFFQSIRLDPESRIPLQDQLVIEICRGMVSGHLKAGDELPNPTPGARLISQKQTFNSALIIRAYKMLESYRVAGSKPYKPTVLSLVPNYYLERLVRVLEKKHTPIEPEALALEFQGGDVDEELYEALKKATLERRAAVGERMPNVTVLATYLRGQGIPISNERVGQVYHRLVEEGVFETHKRSGTLVRGSQKSDDHESLLRRIPRLVDTLRWLRGLVGRSANDPEMRELVNRCAEDFGVRLDWPDAEE